MNPPMGNTCASLHLALPDTIDDRDAVKGIVRAYAKLGFERSTTESEGSKHVLLLRHAGDAFLSVYDSDNATVDTGELKELALAATKIFKTGALCTSLYDSDTFEVVVFNAGKQVDLVMTSPSEYTGPLKILKNASRATQWNKVFGRTLRAEDFTRATTQDSVFADDTVAELSRLAGLTDGRSQLHYNDVLSDGSLTQHLHLTRQASAARTVPEGQVALRNFFDPDNSRMLLVYPASWPMALQEDTRVTWLMLSEGAGFNGGSLVIHVTGPQGLTVVSGYLDGSKFHNGQIVGPLETAPAETANASIEELLKSKQFEVIAVPPSPDSSDAGGRRTGPGDSSASRTFTARFPPLLQIPTKAPGRPTQILVLLQLQLVASQVGEWEIAVSVRPASPTEYQHDLPRARFAAVEQTWLPVVSGLNPRASYETGDLTTLQPRGPVMLHDLQHHQASIRRNRLLNHFAIAANVAIVRDEGQATLDACRSYIEPWLRSLEGRTGEVRIRAEKRMTEKAYVGKSQKTLALSEFRRDKAWTKLFDSGSNYQTVLAAIVPEDAEYPIAGIGVQVGLEQYPEQWREYHEQQQAQTLTKMRGRPFDEAPVAHTVHVFNWVLNHADCYEYLGTSIDDMKKGIDAFAAQHAVLQAWHSQFTWRPLFDHAEDYHRTVYEENSVLNWFRGIVETDGGLDMRKMSVQWCRNVLRMVTPHMWICRALIEQVDRPALESVAEVSEINDAFRLSLRAGRAMDDLELALLPILPVESVRLQPR